MVLLLVCLKTKSGLQNKQAGIDITMVEKYLYEVAAQTLDIADKKNLVRLICAQNRSQTRKFISRF